MEIPSQSTNAFLFLSEYITYGVNMFGLWIYVLLFLIIFAETGLVVTPFLPGDSLLFVTGTLAGGGFLNVWILYLTLLTAAILGDSVNYWLGHHFGPKVFSKEDSRLFNKTYLKKTHDFYEKHGGKAIILARFLPIFRTFTPFVAGIGNMEYKTFFFYNILGAFIWVTSLVFTGYFFGGLSIVQNNVETAVLLLVCIVLVPTIIKFIKKKFHIKDKTSDPI